MQPFDYIETDGITFSSYLNGMLFHSEISLNENPWNDEMELIIKECRTRIKVERAREVERVEQSISLLGENAGKKSYRFDLDNRLYFAMKSKGVVVSRFINEAIAEKLQRE
jgi:hypothetical protein